MSSKVGEESSVGFGVEESKSSKKRNSKVGESEDAEKGIEYFSEEIISTANVHEKQPNNRESQNELPDQNIVLVSSSEMIGMSNEQRADNSEDGNGEADQEEKYGTSDFVKSQTRKESKIQKSQFQLHKSENPENPETVEPSSSNAGQRKQSTQPSSISQKSQKMSSQQSQQKQPSQVQNSSQSQQEGHLKDFYQPYPEQEIHGVPSNQSNFPIESGSTNPQQAQSAQASQSQHLKDGYQPYPEQEIHKPKRKQTMAYPQSYSTLSEARGDTNDPQQSQAPPTSSSQMKSSSQQQQGSQIASTSKFQQQQRSSQQVPSSTGGGGGGPGGGSHIYSQNASSPLVYQTSITVSNPPQMSMVSSAASTGCSCSVCDCEPPEANQGSASISGSTTTQQGPGYVQIFVVPRKEDVKSSKSKASTRSKRSKKSRKGKKKGKSKKGSKKKKKKGKKSKSKASLRSAKSKKCLASLPNPADLETVIKLLNVVRDLPIDNEGNIQCSSQQRSIIEAAMMAKMEESKANSVIPAEAQTFNPAMFDAAAQSEMQQKIFKESNFTFNEWGMFICPPGKNQPNNELVPGESRETLPFGAGGGSRMGMGSTVSKSPSKSTQMSETGIVEVGNSSSTSRRRENPPLIDEVQKHMSFSENNGNFSRASMQNQASIKEGSGHSGQISNQIAQTEGGCIFIDYNRIIQMQKTYNPQQEAESEQQNESIHDKRQSVAGSTASVNQPEPEDTIQVQQSESSRKKSSIATGTTRKSVSGRKEGEEEEEEKDWSKLSPEEKRAEMEKHPYPDFVPPYDIFWNTPNQTRCPVSRRITFHRNRMCNGCYAQCPNNQNTNGNSEFYTYRRKIPQRQNIQQQQQQQNPQQGTSSNPNTIQGPPFYGYEVEKNHQASLYKENKPKQGQNDQSNPHSRQPC